MIGDYLILTKNGEFSGWNLVRLVGVGFLQWPANWPIEIGFWWQRHAANRHRCRVRANGWIGFMVWMDTFTINHYFDEVWFMLEVLEFSLQMIFKLLTFTKTQASFGRGVKQLIFSF